MLGTEDILVSAAAKCHLEATPSVSSGTLLIAESTSGAGAGERKGSNSACNPEAALACMTFEGPCRPSGIGAQGSGERGWVWQWCIQQSQPCMHDWSLASHSFKNLCGKARHLSHGPVMGSRFLMLSRSWCWAMPCNEPT